MDFGGECPKKKGTEKCHVFENLGGGTKNKP